MVVAVVVLVGGLLVAVPSLGGDIVCKVEQAVAALSGGSASCTSHEPSAGARPGEAGGLSVAPGGAPGPGTSRVDYEVAAPAGQRWTVESDSTWAVPTAPGGAGPGTASVVVHANPGQTRTATLTFTGADGAIVTQQIVQGGASAQTVVLGDSFSAGNGSLKKHPDDKDTDGCHRSSMSWARQLESGMPTAAGTPDVRLLAFAACSGSTVDGTNLNDRKTSPSLLDQVNANRDALAGVDQVAFSIGGNDIGFASIVQDCIVPVRTVKNCHNAVTKGRARINGADGQPSPLGERLEEAFAAVVAAAPAATVYVAGYPPMVELDDTSGGAFLGLGEIKAQNRQEVVDMIAELNNQIAASADKVNASTPGGGRLVFVDPTKPGSPFHGHSLTDDVPYYNGLSVRLWPPGPNPWAYHPNDAGNSAYAQWVGWHMMGGR